MTAPESFNPRLSGRVLAPAGSRVETYALIQALHTEQVGWGSDEMRELFRAHNARFLG